MQYITIEVENENDASFIQLLLSQLKCVHRISKDSDADWDKSFESSQNQLVTLANEALNEHLQGNSRPIEELWNP